MRVILEAYKNLVEFIHANVKDDNGEPLYKYIDLWNEQTEFPELEHCFDYPACFVEFSVNNVEGIGLFGKTLEVIITLYHTEVSYLDTHRGVAEGIDNGLKYMENLARLDEQVQAYHHPTTGSLQSLGMAKYKTITNLNIHSLSYKAMLMDQAATDVKRQTETVTVDAELAIQKYPHQNPVKDGSGEMWYDLS